MDRARRSMRVTTRVSPLARNSRTLASCSRPTVVVPDTFSALMGSHPAAFSASTWSVRSWSVVPTRAYPMTVILGAFCLVRL